MSAERLRRYFVRVLVVLLCLAALWDLRPFAGGAGDLPIAVLDVSQSVGAGGPEAPAGVRLQPHWVVVADGAQRVVGAAEPVRLRRTATRIGAGLRAAAEAWPGADVLLLTDGRDTDGDALAGARTVAAAGGRVFVGPPARPSADVGLLQAHIESSGAEARIVARVAASTSGRAEIRLSREGRIVQRRPLVLAPGRVQEIRLVDATPSPAGGSYRVVLVPAPDTPNDDPGNDVLHLGLRPRKRVVLTWGLGSESTRLSGRNLVVRRVEERGVDMDPGDLASADCLVMADLPWRDVGQEAADAIEGFVAAGGSLLLLGGPDAYARGRWAGSRFERRLAALRVPREEGTGLALVLAIDRSGSTAGATLAHLQEAVRRAVQGIVPGERMAVLPFDRKPAAAFLAPGLLEAGDAVGLTTLLAELDALEAGGNTNLVAVLDDAIRRLSDVPARERRVLLLTDGDPDRAPDRAALQEVGRFARAQGVTLAALVVGDPTAVRVLRETVAVDPMDVQPLEDPQDLPLRLLHWLGSLQNRSAYLPRPTRLVAASDVPDVEALTSFRPRELERLELAGDVGARLLVQAVYEDLPTRESPFAAERPVGAGRSVAVAWGPMFEKVRDRGDALARLQPWVDRLAARADRGLAAEVQDDRLRVRFPAAAGTGGIRARTPTSEVRLLEREPALFEGPLPDGVDQGIWVRTESADGPPGRERSLRLPALPPAESRGVGPDLMRMAAIAEAGGGRRLAPGEQPPQPARKRGVPLAPWLLLAACALLLLDRLWSKPLGSPTD